MTIADISTSLPINPRVINEEDLAKLKSNMDLFGDLSSIVINKTTGHRVSGHQRIKTLGPCELIDRVESIEPDGTVERAAVLDEHGNRWPVRIVEWDEEKERAAALAANASGGRWDFIMLEEEFSLHELESAGFNEDDLAMLEFPDEDPETTSPRASTGGRARTAEPIDNTSGVYQIVIYTDGLASAEEILEYAKSVGARGEFAPGSQV
jgi:hypothetical protein